MSHLAASYRAALAAICVVIAIISHGATAAEIDCVRQIVSNDQTGRVYQLLPFGQGLRGSTEHGLYRISLTGEKPALSVVRGTEDTFTAFAKTIGDEIFIASKKGLLAYHVADNSAVKIPSPETGLIQTILSHESKIFVGAEKGLFVLSEGRLVGPLVNSEVTIISDTTFGTFAGTDGVLYVLDNGQWKPLAQNIPRTYAIIAHPTIPKTLVLGTEHGVYFVQVSDAGAKVYDLDFLTPPLGLVRHILAKSNGILIGARTGMFKIETDTLNQPHVTQIPSFQFISIATPERFDTQLVYEIADINASEFATSDLGLFRITNEVLRQVPGITATGPFYHVVPYENRILLPGREGIFEYQVEDLSTDDLKRVDAKHLIAGRNAEGVRVRVALRRCIGAAATLPFAWTLEGSSIATKRGLARLSERNDKGAAFDITFDQLENEALGRQSLKLMALTPMGQKEIVSVVPVSIDRDWPQLLARAAMSAGVATTLAHFIFYASLILLAPRRSWAFETLFNSRFGKGRLYFTELLGRSRWLQLYVFSSCYLRYQKRLMATPNGSYFPVPLSSDAGKPLTSGNILELLTAERRLALLGGPGRGKTAALNELVRQFFPAHLLKEAWHKHRFFALPVKLRYLRRVEKRDKEWLVRIVQLELSEVGFSIDDEHVI